MKQNFQQFEDLLTYSTCFWNKYENNVYYVYFGFRRFIFKQGEISAWFRRAQTSPGPCREKGPWEKWFTITPTGRYKKEGIPPEYAFSSFSGSDSARLLSNLIAAWFDVSDILAHYNLTSKILKKSIFVQQNLFDWIRTLPTLSLYCNRGDLENFVKLYSFSKFLAFDLVEIETLFRYFPSKSRLHTILDSFPTSHRDTLSMLEEFLQAGFEIDRKEVKSWKTLHDLLARDYRKLSTRNIEYNLREDILGLEELDHPKYKAVVPRNSHELIEWGVQMKNCIGSYGSKFCEAQNFLFAIIDKAEDKMLVNAQIRDGSLHQCYYKANQIVGENDPCRDFINEVVGKYKEIKLNRSVEVFNNARRQ